MPDIPDGFRDDLTAEDMVEYYQETVEYLVDGAQFNDEIAQDLSNRRHYTTFREKAFRWRKMARDTYNSYREWREEIDE